MVVRNPVTKFGRAAAIIAAMLAAACAASAQTAPGADMAPAAALAPQQLDNLVGPIALYPDPLLAQVLAASTYPVELVEAQQWLLANQNLNGQPLMDAARQQNWDPSVQALVAMPNVLALLTQDVRWTTDLGNAFLAQQADVMSAVQRMRQRAQANGQLRSGPQETVTTENQGGQQAIDIQPANPQEVYVPAYDPYYVYGYGDYPPLYYPDGYWFEPGIDMGFWFGGWGGWAWGGWGWGWGFNWFGRGLFVNSLFLNRYGFHHGYGVAGGLTAWAHDPAHRLGASYPNGQLNSRFGAASQASRIAAGRSGNWHSFGEGNIGARGASMNGGLGAVAPRAGVPQAGMRGAESFQGGNRSPASAAPRSAAPAQRGYAAPAQRAPSNAAPQRSFQSAPHAAAPSYGGGGARSFGGGGGGAGASHAGGGGGASHAGGGGRR